ncbi:MAG: tryptophan synthase subunit alpha, partial [Deltaproteobacteria bacterium]|nr:tryptophan synthase subunit alpha [Deltaproteobacteria bacterium]MBW2718460.1 tryptophan synthase subunit alpha [Deltaproteobacteria bacterium]
RPVAIGFGVKTKDDVATVAPHVDGVVVGSAVVSAIEDATSPEAAVGSVRELVSELAQGLSRQ